MLTRASDLAARLFKRCLTWLQFPQSQFFVISISCNCTVCQAACYSVTFGSGPQLDQSYLSQLSLPHTECGTDSRTLQDTTLQIRRYNTANTLAQETLCAKPRASLPADPYAVLPRNRFSCLYRLSQHVPCNRRKFRRRALAVHQPAVAVQVHKPKNYPTNRCCAEQQLCTDISDQISIYDCESERRSCHMQVPSQYRQCPRET